jgi:hypothetical protein
MRKQVLTLLALVGSALLAPATLNAQTIIHDRTGSLATPGGTAIFNFTNPRGTSYFHDAYQIPLVAGRKYTIRMRSTAVGPDSYIYLRNPSGTVVIQDDDGDYSVQIWSSKMEYTPTVSGTYILHCTTFSGGAQFPYRTWTEEVTQQPAPPPTPLAVPGQAGGSLTSTDPQAGNPRNTNGGYYYDRYVVTLTQGRDYKFNLNASGDPYLFLLGPTGATLAQNDDANGSLNSEIKFTAQTSGQYILVATSFSQNAQFSYTIITADLSPGTPGTAIIPNVRAIPSDLDRNEAYSWLRESPRLGDRIPAEVSIHSVCRHGVIQSPLDRKRV